MNFYIASHKSILLSIIFVVYFHLKPSNYKELIITKHVKLSKIWKTWAQSGSSLKATTKASWAKYSKEGLSGPGYQSQWTVWVKYTFGSVISVAILRITLILSDFKFTISTESADLAASPLSESSADFLWCIQLAYRQTLFKMLRPLYFSRFLWKLFCN